MSVVVRVEGVGGKREWLGSESQGEVKNVGWKRKKCGASSYRKERIVLPEEQEEERERRKDVIPARGIVVLRLDGESFKQRGIVFLYIECIRVTLAVPLFRCTHGGTARQRVPGQG